MRKTLTAAAALIMLFALSACSNSANPQTSSTQTQNTSQIPLITLESWSYVYLPKDNSDLEQYLFAFSFKSTVPITADKGAHLYIELLKGDESKLIADAYYDDVTFNGLTEFTVATSLNNYLLDEDQMNIIKDIDNVKVEVGLTTSSSPATESSPMAYTVLDKENLAVEKTSYGVRNDLLSIKNNNYPEMGACVLKIKGQEKPMIVSMAEDLKDTELYSGYSSKSIDMSKIESVIICAQANAKP